MYMYICICICIRIGKCICICIMYRYMHMHAYNYISSSIFYSNSLASGHLHHGGTASDHTKASSWTRGVPRKLTSKITGKWMLCSSTCVLCWCIIYIYYIVQCILCNVYCVYIYILTLAFLYLRNIAKYKWYEHV